MYRASDRPELGDQHQSLAFWGTQGPTAGIGLSPDPGATLRLVANDLASHSGSFAVGGLFAVIAGGMATWAAPRVWHGVDGWVRHLPADWPAHRRALLEALTAAHLPETASAALSVRAGSTIMHALPDDAAARGGLLDSLARGA